MGKYLRVWLSLALLIQPASSAFAQSSVPEGNSTAQTSKDRRCFDGYCPCDTSDPDYGGMDELVCRLLRNDMHVDRETMVLAAASRDARRQLREFKN